MDIKKIKPENLDGIHMDQDRVQREALLNMVMKCMDPEKFLDYMSDQYFLKETSAL
jgi:hypothetical protein